MRLSDRKSKQIIAEFLRTSFCDLSLRNLYEAAKLGRVQWYSCDPQTFGCLVVRSDKRYMVSPVFSKPAEAYNSLGYGLFASSSDKRRHKHLTPLIEAEISRRAEGRKLTEQLRSVEPEEAPETLTMKGTENGISSNQSIPTEPLQR